MDDTRRWDIIAHTGGRDYVDNKERRARISNAERWGYLKKEECMRKEDNKSIWVSFCS